MSQISYRWGQTSMLHPPEVAFIPIWNNSFATFVSQLDDFGLFNQNKQSNCAQIDWKVTSMLVTDSEDEMCDNFHMLGHKGYKWSERSSGSRIDHSSGSTVMKPQFWLLLIPYLVRVVKRVMITCLHRDKNSRLSPSFKSFSAKSTNFTPNESTSPQMSLL